VLLVLSKANRRCSGLRSLFSAACVHWFSSKENKGTCPASGTRVALGEAVEVATVLLAGAEVPCWAAADRTRDDDRTIRESCMINVTKAERIWNRMNFVVRQKNALTNLLYPKQQTCTAQQSMLLPTCVAKPLAGVD
jgi:hypothetical protein